MTESLSTQSPAPESPAPERKHSPAVRILLNAMSGAGSRIATMCIGFLLTPIIIADLGLTQYGLWSVVGTLSQYLGLLDFGVGGAFVKFITEYVERNDRASARQVVVFGMLFYAAFGIVLAAPILIFAPQIIHVFKMPQHEYVAGTGVLRIVFVMLIFFMIVNVPGMVVVSMQRMDLASRNNFVAYLIYAAGTVLFLRMHYGIYAILIGQGFSIAAIAIMQIGTATRLFGTLWHNPLKIDRKIVGRLFAFGGWTQITSILSAINQDVGRFVGAGAVSVASVAVFEIANKPAFFARIFPAYLLDALMPPLVAADARGDEEQLEKLYAAGTRFSVFVALLFAGFAIGGADPLIRVWLGRSYPFVSEIVFWMATGYAISALAGTGTTLLRASGKPQYETYFMVAATVGTVASTLVLVRPFGIVGVAMGTTIGWLVATIYFVIFFHTLRPGPWWPTIGSPSARMLVAGILATAGFFALVHVPAIARAFDNRLLGLIVFAIAAAAYAGAFVGLTTLFGVWVHDGDQIAARFAGLRARFRKGDLRVQGDRA